MKSSMAYRIAAALAGLAGVVALAAYPKDKDGKPAPAPLFDQLGSYERDVSTKDPLAQRYFNQGMMFLWGFNHHEAVRSFKAAAELDPQLAIAWWGVAFAHGPNINAPMEEGARPPALAALDQARALARHGSNWERAWIEALGARYLEKPDTDQAELNVAYAKAMQDVARRFPDDLDTAVLHADAVMNTMAWDYWLADRTTPKPETREIIAALEAVLAQDPHHPGANHALIHLVEAGPEPAQGLASAERLRFYAPDAGHLVHMPSHIFMRTGMYQEAALANERAAKADRAYITSCQVQGFYPGMYYPHNEHFLWWAYTFQGRKADSVEKAGKIVALASSPICGTPVAEKQRFTHLSLLTAVRFGDAEAILAATEPPEAEPLDRVMWHWARATAYSARGDAAAATREANATREIAGGEAVAAMDNVYLPAIKIAGIAARLAEGRAALARGETEAGLGALREAVALEDAMPYMEPAFWFYPTRHTLGAALLGLGRADEAAAVFREDLKVWPENGWALHGLALALEKQGDAPGAAAARKRFEQAWQQADVAPTLAMY
ncbi:MAG TPA: hypothetical protein VNR00_04755 [Opitutus sp.]|nr:hypothetical protein [Opitutus sp.]